jgi:hypothetical protein
MSSAELFRWLRYQPFQAFRICMTDGAAFDIHHPEQVIPSKGTAVITQRRSPGSLSDRDTTISLLHVVRLEPIDDEA